nr:unnamed protein product [Digitaria exilis]
MSTSPPPQTPSVLGDWWERRCSSLDVLGCCAVEVLDSRAGGSGTPRRLDLGHRVMEVLGCRAGGARGWWGRSLGRHGTGWHGCSIEGGDTTRRWRGCVIGNLVGDARRKKREADGATSAPGCDARTGRVTSLSLLATNVALGPPSCACCFIGGGVPGETWHRVARLFN